MIPGLIFRRARFSDYFVPLICCLEILIDIYNYSAIVKKAMMHQLANGESDLCDICYSSDAFDTVVVLIKLLTLRISGKVRA